MAEVALLESTHTEALLSAPPEPVAVPDHTPEEEPQLERSPAVSAADYAARLTAPAAAERRTVAGAVVRLQSEYGNAYAVELIAQLRSRATTEAEAEDSTEALVAEAEAVTTGRPAPVAAEAPAAPSPRPLPEPTSEIEATPEPEPESTPPPGPPEPEASPAVAAAPAEIPNEPAEAPAAPAPEPPAPEPAPGPAAELSGEEPAGGQVEIAAAGGAAAGEVETPTAAGPVAAGPEEAPAEGEGPTAEGETPAAEEQAPSSPEEDPAFQAVLGRVRIVARSQGHNNPAQRKAAEAQAAAPPPANELQDAAAGQQVSEMAEQDPLPFDKEKFKRALMEKVAAIAPRTLEEADEFKEKNKSASLKGDVASNVSESKEKTQGPVKEAATETPDTGSVEPKPVEPLPPTDPGPPPPDIGAEAAAPKPKPASEVSLEQNSREIDDLAQSSDPPITEELVEKSNEPEFKSAYEAKDTAQQDAAERPADYREQEQSVLAGAQQEAASNAATQTQAMHETRDEQFGAIVDVQGETQSEDQTRREKVLQDLRNIYEETKSKVTDRLDRLDGEVNTAFDSGAESARQKFDTYVDQRMRAYKARRYSGVTGAALWVHDKLLGMPEEVNAFYVEGRNLYIQLMDAVIDHVAGIVAAGLNEAMAIIAEGRQRVQAYLESLPEELREVGQDAAAGIQAEFDQLAQDVTNRQDQLVDSLAQRYTDNLAAVDAAIEEMQAANRGLVDAALEAVGGVIATIIEMKNMLLGVLARAQDVIGTILADPIGFLGNLIAAVRLGLDNFIGNIGTHLQQGLMGWLFGALAEAGIQMPESFDLRGILSLVLQVLGLTYANIRARAVAIVGEPVVAALEQAAEIFRVLITQGPAGLWEYIKEHLANMRDMVIEGIKSFVMERIIMAGITWLIGLLNPAGAFIKACKAIYDIVMFFVTRGSQIMAMVNAILDSMSAIASGAIGGAAAAVENALGRSVPVVIGFLASLLGLGGISQKIREIIQRIQAPINAAIDWVINKAVQMAKAVGNLFGGKKDEQAPETGDPQHDAQVVAALAAIDQEEQKYAQGKISEEEALRVAATVKQQHLVLKTLVPKEGAEKWKYEWTASPGGVHTGAHERIGNMVIRDIREEIPAELQARLAEAGSDWRRYEEAAVMGVTKEVLRPEWEEEIGVPIRMTERGGLASAQYEARLRVQRGHRAPGIGTVQPEASMEVMAPRGRGAISSVYKVEATLVEDYSTSTHKMTQLYQTGSTIKAKYGTTIPVQYHILCPRPPSPETIEEVNNAISRIGIPNVTVVWNVTG